MIREHQNLPELALEAFKRALPLYAETDGDSSYRTNQVRVKLAEHYSRLQQPEAARYVLAVCYDIIVSQIFRMMFDDALKYFGSSPFYQPETARTLFKKHEFLAAFGDDVEAEDARSEAERLFKKLRPEVAIKAEGLTTEDFDRIVMIMSR